MSAAVLRSSDQATAILSFLSPTDLAKSLPACRQFKSCGFNAWKVQARSRSEVSLERLWEDRVFMMNSLKKGDANYTEILDLMPNVKTLTLDCREVSPFAFLEGAMDEILLSRTMRSLTSLVISITLPDQHFADEHLAGIAENCHALNTLEIHRFIEVERRNQIDLVLSDDGVAHLQKLTHLQRLSIHYAPAITNRSLKILAEMPTLTSLRLSACNITKQGVDSFLSKTASRKASFDDTAPAS